MSLTKLSLAGKNVPNPSPLKVWSKTIQESCNIFYSVTATAAGLPMTAAGLPMTAAGLPTTAET